MEGARALMHESQLDVNFIATLTGFCLREGANP